MNKKREFDYLERPETIRKLWILLHAACAVLVILDFFPPDRHPHFGFDGLFGFYPLLGFISCAVLILFSKLVGLFLKVEEDYYDR